MNRNGTGDTCRSQSRPLSSSAHDDQGGKSSGEPWNKTVSDWFQKKKNVFLIGPVKFRRARVDMRRVWRFQDNSRAQAE